ncbi:MAG: nucleotidyltransferase domain-containing protein [Planctomycetota bacterium]
MFFQANPACPVFSELKGLVSKTAGAADVLTSALGPLADRIEGAFIYGSVARGKEKPESDVDVFVVGDVRFADVVSAVSGSEDILAREVNPTVMPVDEFKAKVKGGNAFIRRLLKGGKIFLIGSEDDLERLAR